MADLNDQAVKDIGASGPGATVSTDELRRADAAEASAYASIVDTGGQAAADSYDQSALDGFKKDMDAVADQVSQGKTKSRSESGTRVEAQLKAFGRVNPHLMDDARGIASRQLGFDATGTENKIKFGTFDHGPESAQAKKERNFAAVSETMIANGHDEYTVEHLRFLDAQKQATDLKTSFTAAQNSRRKQTQLTNADDYFSDTQGQTIAELRGMNAAFTGTDDERMAMIDFAANEYIQKYVDYQSGLNSDGGFTTGVDGEARDRYTQQLGTLTKLVKAQSLASTATKVAQAGTKERQAMDELWFANSENGRLLHFVDSTNPRNINTLERILATTEVNSTARQNMLDAELKLTGAFYRSNRENLANGLRRLGDKIQQPGQADQAGMPNNEEDAAIDRVIGKEATNDARKNKDWSIASFINDTNFDLGLNFTDISNYTARGTGRDLGMDKSEAGMRIKKQLQDSFDANFQPLMDEAVDFFKKTPGVDLIFNNKTNRLEVQTDEVLVTRLNTDTTSSLMVPHSNLFMKAQTYEKSLNAYGDYLYGGGNAFWMDIDPRQKGLAYYTFTADTIMDNKDAYQAAQAEAARLASVGEANEAIRQQPSRARGFVRGQTAFTQRELADQPLSEAEQITDGATTRGVGEDYLQRGFEEEAGFEGTDTLPRRSHEALVRTASTEMEQRMAEMGSFRNRAAESEAMIAENPGLLTREGIGSFEGEQIVEAGAPLNLGAEEKHGPPQRKDVIAGPPTLESIQREAESEEEENFDIFDSDPVKMDRIIKRYEDRVTTRLGDTAEDYTPEDIRTLAEIENRRDQKKARDKMQKEVKQAARIREQEGKETLERNLDQAVTELAVDEAGFTRLDTANTEVDTPKKTFIKEMNKWEGPHGSTPKATNDASEAHKAEADRSKDLGFGHKVTESEEKSGMIHNIQFKDSAGAYIPLSKDQQLTIKEADIEANVALARRDWDARLAALGSDWDSLDTKYQLALSDLAYHVGGDKAGKKWKTILKRAVDRDDQEFVRELRRKDAGQHTHGMDNRAAKAAHAAGLIDTLQDAHNAGLTLASVIK